MLGGKKQARSIESLHKTTGLWGFGTFCVGKNEFGVGEDTDLTQRSKCRKRFDKLRLNHRCPVDHSVSFVKIVPLKIFLAKFFVVVDFLKYSMLKKINK